MPWVAAAGAVVGGALGGMGSQGAADAQEAAANKSLEFQRELLKQQTAQLSPYMQAGNQALQQLLGYSQNIQPFSMDQALPTFQAYTGMGPEQTQAQTYATQSALDAMRNQMQMGGQGLSSNAISGAGKLAGDIGSQYQAQDFSQWLAGQQQGFGQALATRQQGMSEWAANQQAQLQPLQYLTGLGQSSAAGSAANMGAMGSNMANVMTQAGNAQAAGIMGQANAAGGTINNLSQMYMLSNLLGNNNTYHMNDMISMPS